MLKTSATVRQRVGQGRSGANVATTDTTTNEKPNNCLPILLMIISFPILFYIISSFVSSYSSSTTNINLQNQKLQKLVNSKLNNDALDNKLVQKEIDLTSPLANVIANNNNNKNINAKNEEIVDNDDIKLALLYSQDPNNANYADSWKYCKDDCEWREDSLVGRCFGPSKVRSIDRSKIENKQSIFLSDSNKNKNTIDNLVECKQYCCDLGNNCVTFQYHPKKGCHVGGNVRLGLERASTGNWCEPKKPRQWLGQRKIEMTDSDSNKNECKFDESDENELKYQCFGLGPEIRGIKDVKSCVDYCCEQGESCQLWQFRDDKGCFTGTKYNCDKDNDPWIGARKTLESVGIDF